jgi:oligopeptide transport system ATP-binding protein
VIRHISDIIAVMYLGRIVELAPVEELFTSPVHPYTKALLSAIPVADPTDDRQRTILHGDVPSPISPPRGCHFHPRCPDAESGCSSVSTPLVEISEGHFVGCPVYAPTAAGANRSV